MSYLFIGDKIKVTITETPCRKNGYSYVLIDDNRQYYHISANKMPSNLEVDDTGYIQYRSLQNCGFYFWIEE